MLNKKTSLFYLIIAAISGIAITAGIMVYKDNGETKKAADAAPPTELGEYNLSRLNGYKFIRPLYMAEPQYESNNFSVLKKEISGYLAKEKANGNIEDVSVYIKDFALEEWMEYNPNKEYTPGALFKVLTMVTFFKMAENNPSLLEQEVLFAEGSTLETAEQTFHSKTISSGSKYKIKDLMYYMVVHSDNNATVLLHQHMDKAVFAKVFTDMGLRYAAINDENYTLTAKEYSRFMSVLFNGKYLSLPASEMALSVLCESDFNEGITKLLPLSLVVAHKYGEAGTEENGQLHESAIVYLNQHPYLLTIMSKGKDKKKLAFVISKISSMVYEHMAKRNG